MFSGLLWFVDLIGREAFPSFWGKPGVLIIRPKNFSLGGEMKGEVGEDIGSSTPSKRSL